MSETSIKYKMTGEDLIFSISQLLATPRFVKTCLKLGKNVFFVLPSSGPPVSSSVSVPESSSAAFKKKWNLFTLCDFTIFFYILLE